MVSVPVSPPGLQRGQQDSAAPLPVRASSLQVQGVRDVTGNQDLYRVSAPRRQGRALWSLLIGRPVDGKDPELYCQAGTSPRRLRHAA